MSFDFLCDECPVPYKLAISLEDGDSGLRREQFKRLAADEGVARGVEAR